MSDIKAAGCPYCGQIVMVDVEDDLISMNMPDDELVRAMHNKAVAVCTCKGAQAERRMKAQRELACESIMEIVCSEYDHTGKELMNFVDLIQQDGVNSVQVTMRDETKIILKKKKDGILVKKQRTKSEEMLA